MSDTETPPDLIEAAKALLMAVEDHEAWVSDKLWTAAENLNDALIAGGHGDIIEQSAIDRDISIRKYTKERAKSGKWKNP